jgi:predicted permease
MRYLLPALRRTVRQPRLPAAAVFVLSLALGAGGASFTLVNALVLEPPPFPFVDRLVTVALGGRSWSPAMLDAATAANTTCELLAGVHERAVAVSGGDGAEMLRLEGVSHPYFTLLGVAPIAGTLWPASADGSGIEGASALISARLWRRTFGGDAAIVGRSIVLDGTPARVVGVLPSTFRGLIGRADIWVPLKFVPSIGAIPGTVERPWSRWFEVIGRLPADRTIDEARSAFDVEARRAMSTLPGADRALGTRWRATLTPLQQERGDRRLARASSVLLAAVAFVVVLACVTLAGLQLLGVLSRSNELAVRLAIGGATRDLVGMIATETAVLAAAGCAGGLLLRRWMIDALLAVRPEASGFGIRAADLLPPEALSLDVASVGIIVAGAFASGLVMAAIPVAAVARRDFGPALRAAAGAAPALSFSGSGRAAAVLVTAEVALASVLLSGAGLMARSAANLWSQDRGFDPGGVLTLRIEPPPLVYQGAGLAGLHATIVERLASVPGVGAASVSSCLPGVGRCRQTNVRLIDGRVPEGQHALVGVTYVTAQHFAVLRTPILRGRAFDERDAAESRPTVMINESAAGKLWPGQDPVGRRLALFFANGQNTGEREVVGVVRNIQFDSIEERVQPDVFLPAAQVTWGSSVLFLRLSRAAAATPDSIRAAIRDVDPRIPVHQIAPLTERLGAGFATERLLALVLGAFAAASLLLAAVGVYGLIAHAVDQGVREVGIRMALGASGGRIAVMLARRASTLVGTGLVLGVAGALLASAPLAAFLFGVPPRDPATLIGVAVLVVFAAAAALYAPLRRASHVDPVSVLRAQ